MDTLATIAICTEPYEANKSSATQSTRISRRDKIMNAIMWRNIIGQFIYQSLTMIVLMYAGHVMFFDQTFNIVTEKLRYTEADPDNGIEINDPTNKMKLHTFIFHTFVLMNLFN